MSLTVAPGSTIELVLDAGQTGLTVGARILDNAGATTTARFTGFTEYPSGAGVYYKTGVTAPSTAGQYTVLYDWDGGTAAPANVATEDMLVTSSSTITVPGGDLSTALSQLRTELGDTNSDAYIFTDAELNYWLSQESNDVLAACLRACDAAARKYSRAYDFSTDGQSFSRSQMAKSFREQADALRASGITTTLDVNVRTVDVTVVDGWSDDVTNQEVTGSTDTARRLNVYPGVDELP